jgi:hypothetical protein
VHTTDRRTIVQTHDNPEARQPAVPLVWMRAIREVAPSRSAEHVLWALALRLDADGTGFASIRQLADDTRMSQETVLRATRWARSAGYLEQTKRGHRKGDGRTVASEWLLLNVSLVTGRGSQPVTPASQPVTREAPEVSIPEWSELDWTAPPVGAGERKDHPSNYDDWRPGDRDLFVSLIGCDDVDLDGGRWKTPGRYRTLALYEAYRREQGWGWPGRYLESIDSHGGLEEWMSTQGIEPTCE